MPSPKAIERRERLQALAKQHALIMPAAPAVNPWQYSNRRDSYPADPDHVDWRDPTKAYRSRLLMAAAVGDADGVQHWLEKGASPYVRDRERHDALFLAASWGHSEIAAHLAKFMDKNVTACRKYERATWVRLGLPSQRRSRGGSPARAVPASYRRLLNHYQRCFGLGR